MELLWIKPNTPELFVTHWCYSAVWCWSAAATYSNFVLSYSHRDLGSSRSSHLSSPLSVFRELTRQQTRLYASDIFQVIHASTHNVKLLCWSSRAPFNGLTGWCWQWDTLIITSESWLLRAVCDGRAKQEGKQMLFSRNAAGGGTRNTARWLVC